MDAVRQMREGPQQVLKLAEDLELLLNMGYNNLEQNLIRYRKFNVDHIHNILKDYEDNPDDIVQGGNMVPTS